MGPLRHVVRAIARTSMDRADIVVITGRNRALYEALSRHSRLSAPPASDASLPISPSAQERRQRRLGRGGGAWHSPIRIEGFVDNMEVWMRAADVLVTKAGPNSVAEALVAGLPLVLYTALPGQEEGNVTYVVENGVGIWAPIPRQAARAVARLLDDTTTRVTMAARSRALAKPWAAEQIAQDLWTLPCHDQRQHLADERYSESHLAHHPIGKHSLRGTRNREVSGW